jgi:hypothetical protein
MGNIFGNNTIGNELVGQLGLGVALFANRHLWGNNLTGINWVN